MMKYSTNAGLHAIIRAIGHYGIDTDQLLQKESISAPINSELQEHVLPSLSEQLVDLAIRETGDAAFPLRVAEYITPITFGEFTMGLVTSSSLRNFLDRFSKYYLYLSTAQKMRLVERDDIAILLSYFAESSVKKSSQSVWVEISLAFAFRYMRLIAGPNYSALKVEFVRTPSVETEQRYLDFFGVAPTFGASRNALYFDAEDLDTPLPNSNLDIVAEYERKIVKKLADFRKGDLPLQVHALLLEELPQRRVSKERVASHFAMSPKTFQNRLSESGTNYQFLLDSAKRELAELYLSLPDASLIEVAEQLGYSDASNFCRAYKRWTGRLPRSG